MSNNLLSSVVEGSKIVVKLRKFKGVRNVVSEMNKSFGYNRFKGIVVNKVYYVSGCGILIEFQDDEKTLSVVSDAKGAVLSCSLALDNAESISIQNKYKCGVAQGHLVLE